VSDRSQGEGRYAALEWVFVWLPLKTHNPDSQPALVRIGETKSAQFTIKPDCQIEAHWLLGFPSDNFLPAEMRIEPLLISFHGGRINRLEANPGIINVNNCARLKFAV
jgi:hypothetical protein